MRRCLQFMFLCVFALPLAAQRSIEDSARFLWSKQMHAEASVLIDRLIADSTKNAEIFVLHGFGLVERAKLPDDSVARRLLRAEAHAAFGRAIALGSTDRQAMAMFAGIPADGGKDPVFSKNGSADSAMQSAERSFAQHDMRGALRGYAHALEIEPASYDAAVFSGDAYMTLNVLDSAYIWYGKATEINPDRETAWRYWSGVLLKNRHPDEARDKAIEAFIAEPYGRLSRTALASWAQSTRTMIGAPRVALPVRDTATTHSKFWVAYDSARKAQGVDAAGHKHTMAEERDALLAANHVSPDDVDVLNIKRMQEAGVLDAFIFFFRPDAGIASEYTAYRAGHHEELRKFLAEWVVGAKYR